MIEIIREHGRITVRDAVILIKANRNTIKKHLKQLYETGYIIQRGEGKGTWYEKKT
ncbi:MAG: hypothetical protein JW841_07195 [Deltaproteobacteria bacterium]|nr:hypothetical protein [Deltaproteobacteria bacterium]